jgi:hypothetical protein
MNGSIAVAAFFDRALSDLELELLKTSRLSEWSALVPQLGVHYGSWTGSSASDVVFAGSSGTATINGTVGTGSDPSSFDFTNPTPAVTIRNGITGGTNSTANTTAYTTGTISSGGLVAGDLFVIYVASTGCTDAAPTLTASANGITFTLVGTAVKNSSADTLYCYIADQFLPSTPSGMSFTFTCTGATGVVISVAIATGMTRSGTAAVKQYAVASNVASGTAPAPTFSSSALTTNPTLIGILASVAGSTPPPGWIERVDANYGSPTTGGGYSSRDSGFIGTTITYESTANGLCCALSLELDVTPPSGTSGTLSGTIPKVTGSIAGDSLNTGSTSATLPKVTGSISGQAVNTGTTSATLPKVTGAIAGASVNTGTTSGTLPTVTGSITGSSTNTGTTSGTIPKVTGSLSGTATNTGTLSGALPAVTGSIADVASLTGTLAATLPAVTGTISGQSVNSGTLSGTLPTVTAAVTGTATNLGTLTANLPPVIGSITDTTFTAGTLTANLPVVTGSIAGQSVNAGTLSGTLPKVTGTTTGQSVNPGALTGTLPLIVGTLTGTAKNNGTLVASLPKVTGLISDRELREITARATLVRTWAAVQPVRSSAETTRAWKAAVTP